MMMQRYFFVHMLKTGGMSVEARLRRHFSDAEIYPNSSDGDPVVVAPQLDVDCLVRRWLERGAEIRWIGGHFPYCTIERLDAEFTPLTVLREPVERTLSFLRNQRRVDPADADCSLEEIYERQPRFDWLVHNHMVKMLSLRSDEIDCGCAHAGGVWLGRAGPGVRCAGRLRPRGTDGGDGRILGGASNTVRDRPRAGRAREPDRCRTGVR